MNILLNDINNSIINNNYLNNIISSSSSFSFHNNNENNDDNKLNSKIENLKLLKIFLALTKVIIVKANEIINIKHNYISASDIHNNKNWDSKVVFFKK